MSIETLTALAEVDQQLQISKRNLREIQQELDIVRKEITDIETQVSLAEKQKEKILLAKKQKKIELDQQEVDIKKKEEKIPYIRNEKEFAASKRELEEVRRKFGVLSDEFLEEEIKIEEIDQTIASLQKTLAEKHTDYDENAKDLVQQKQVFEEQIAGFLNIQEEKLQSLPSDLKGFYKRQASRGVILPFAPIANKNCGGCHLLLPPQFINELMTNPNECNSCPHCGRLLYYKPEEVTEEVIES